MTFRHQLYRFVCQALVLCTSLTPATPLRPELSSNPDVQRIPDTPSQMSFRGGISRQLLLTKVILPPLKRLTSRLGK